MSVLSFNRNPPPPPPRFLPPVLQLSCHLSKSFICHMNHPGSRTSFSHVKSLSKRPLMVQNTLFQLWRLYLYMRVIFESATMWQTVFISVPCQGLFPLPQNSVLTRPCRYWSCNLRILVWCIRTRREWSLGAGGCNGSRMGWIIIHTRC